MELIPLVSVILEAMIALLAIYIASKGRPYLFGFAVTFGMYVFYDLARLYAFPVSEETLAGIFFVATLAALISMLGLLRKS